jgi:hypothetical protein
MYGSSSKKLSLNACSAGIPTPAGPGSNFDEFKSSAGIGLPFLSNFIVLIGEISRAS